MKKYILKIVIIILFLNLFISKTEASLFIKTYDADNITQTTARLHGEGGTSSTYPVTAYFRYSKADISPIFCNDIYGTNMISTKDINLGTTTTSSFYQKIENLTPNTKYYYCAIISDKDNIAYGGENVVKSFYTSPIKTTVNTKNATQITSTSATLNGSYNSFKNIKTYFKYKEEITKKNNLSFNFIKEFIVNKLINIALAYDLPLSWKKVGEQNYKIGKYDNIHGTITYNLKGLKPSTKYTFLAVAEDKDEIVTGTSVSFTTNSSEIIKTSGVVNENGGESGSDQNGRGGGDRGENNGRNGGIINTTPLTLGQIILPPSIDIVRYGEGIETVFVRQITEDIEFAKIYGYKETNDIKSFAWNLADQFARAFGYVNANGKEIRVSSPDIAAYQLQLIGNKLTVYEYYNGKIIDVRNLTTVFKNASGYEYYFKKR